MQKKIMTIILSIALIFSGILSLISIYRLQGNARVINYAGIVRGATQRLIKEELHGQPNDTLVTKLDGILHELQTGEGTNNLTRLKDNDFQDHMSRMLIEWTALKEEIANVRAGADNQQLYLMSEDYFDLADQTVFSAETYTEKSIRTAKIGFLALTLVFAATALLLSWYSRIQARRKEMLRAAEQANRERSENLERMSENIWAPMNDILELVYVADLENYDLLFMNEAGRKTFHVDELKGEKCYKILQGFDSPCPFCTNKFLKEGETYTWELTNALTQRHYMLKDRLIEWEGRNVRLEIAVDNTDAEKEKEKMKYALSVEHKVMECVRLLYQGHDMEKALDRLLQQLGTFLGADRVYIFRTKEDSAIKNREWCADGILSHLSFLTDVPSSLSEYWNPSREHQNCYIIEDVETLKDVQPHNYELLRSFGTHSIVIAPLEQNNILNGCLVVENPPPDKLWNIDSLLQTLCYFVMLALGRAENEKTLSHLSYHDILTSFYNRNKYMQDLDTLTDSHVSMGIVYLDVNGLKDINDKYGHAYGDDVLVECAKRIQAVFKQSALYRIGGDEFVVICTQDSADVFEQKVRKLRIAFRHDNLYNAAIGSEWTNDSSDIRQIVANADAKMYENKKEYYRKHPVSKRYRHQNDELLPLSNPQILRREILVGHFLVYMQPKVSLPSATIIGAEALIRYQSTDGSIVQPGSFLPLLEEVQLINLIDMFVFETVCSRINKWEKLGWKSVPISINFSRHTLSQPDIIAHLTSICSKYGIVPGQIEIEVTETVQEIEGQDICTLIHDLKEVGFLISIDDFGTEYSNLSLLFSIDFDVLKLDKSIIDDIAVNEKAQMIVQYIADISKRTDIKLIAEGIETIDQMNIIKKCGVELAQGYLFGKPVPIEVFFEDCMELCAQTPVK